MQNRQWEEPFSMYCVRKGEDGYPKRMQELSGMPRELYIRGQLPCDKQPTAAIVGARTCSSYGKNMAQEFARVLSNAGVQVISGLAMGIDGEAHVGALKGTTPTFGILACDVSQCYPKCHQKLYDRILQQQGGILSEQPPGTQARPCFFPARNRIISALADVVIVMEARVKSGSLITVDFALEQGKSVFALPGRVGDSLSEGCHRLIAQGAAIAYSPEAILTELGWKHGQKNSGSNLLPCTREAREVLGLLEQNPKSLQEITEKLTYSSQTVMSALLELQLKDLAVEVSKNYYIKKIRL